MYMCVVRAWRATSVFYVLSNITEQINETNHTKHLFIARESWALGAGSWGLGAASWQLGGQQSMFLITSGTSGHIIIVSLTCVSQSPTARVATYSNFKTFLSETPTRGCLMEVME